MTTELFTPPNLYQCPNCGHTDFYREFDSSPLLRCYHCRKVIFLTEAAYYLIEEFYYHVQLKGVFSLYSEVGDALKLPEYHS